MNLQAAASQHRPAWSSSASCQLPAIRRCAARCWPTLSKLLAGVILAVRSLYALAGHADSRFYCTLDSGASGANERKSACFHGLLSVSARRGRQRVGHCLVSGLSCAQRACCLCDVRGDDRSCARCEWLAAARGAALVVQCADLGRALSCCAGALEFESSRRIR